MTYSNCIASQLQACYFAVIKLLLPCIRMACSVCVQLSTGLLQVECQDFLSTSLTKPILKALSCIQSDVHKLNSAADLLQLDHKPI